MLEVIYQNIGTIVLSLVIATIVGLIIWKMISDKRKGKSSCGCGCSDCANSELCHGHHNK